MIVNLSCDALTGKVRVPWDEMIGMRWQLNDHLNGDSYVREGDEMRGPGMYLSLASWGYHFFACKALS